ncbi:MAG: carbohydrate kinase [Turicibacter sp.]|nr:carbohydrate kinase [Turicibacter sp.]
MLFTIGEVLIDFVAEQKGCSISEATSFRKIAGGAPANVAAAVAKLGGKSALITQVGQDGFGDFLIQSLANAGVDTSYIQRIEQANTGLAFVSVKSDGERDFSFYRNPSADLLLAPENVQESWFKEGDYLHFCSVDLVESPMKETHRQVIQWVKAKNGTISFDPNVRLSLWENPDDCRQAILDFIPYAHILKISDEELAFISGIEEESAALQSLFVGDVEAILYTKGAEGAVLITKEHSFYQQGFKVKVEDTTGAGDAFIGSFLHQLVAHGVKKEGLVSFLTENHSEMLTFANAAAALTVTGKGAIGALPKLPVLEKFISEGVQDNELARII